ncbi:hypothetical protein E3T23_13655 [Cryobacterium cheniae]|uniref:Uncharacterized protein n=1 Tax=Cryobacterium cheniae TaxID=1259262 RepID=A0A4R8XIV3_9MICO|nr:hypothetical protein E3T23_13655 [Cryobacterium cheniae]
MPVRPGDNTPPPDHGRLGARTMPGLTGQHPHITTRSRRISKPQRPHQNSMLRSRSLTSSSGTSVGSRTSII